MSSPTILFVLCVNDESMFQACFRQLASLPAPHGYHVEVLPIRHASSMASAYNEALTHPAQFKIYLHQDTLIVKQHMLLELIPLFLQNPSLGMLGVIGAESVPDNGIWWESHDCRGKVIEYRHDTYQLRLNLVIHRQSPKVISKLLLLTGFLWQHNMISSGARIF